MTEIFFITTFFLAPLLAIIIGVFLVINGFILLKKEGKSLTNMLSLGLGIVILAFFIVISVFVYNVDTIFNYSTISGIFFMGIILFIFSYFIFGFSFLGFLFYSIFYHILPKNKKYDFIIIHGAGLLNSREVTPLLKGRIDTALKAFHKSKNPNVKIIASGW